MSGQIISTILIAVSLVSCTVSKRQENIDAITGVNFITMLPVVTMEGELSEFGDTSSVYFYRDITIYQLPTHYSNYNLNYFADNDSVSQTLSSSGKIYRYFVFRNGSSFGFMYKPNERKDSSERIHLDSALSGKGVPPNLQQIALNDNDSLVDRQAFDRGRKFVEKYVNKIKFNETYNDTSFLYFSKDWSNVRFSLVPYLDSLRSAKFYKLRLKYNQSYNQDYKMTIPQREVLYEFYPLSEIDHNKIGLLIQRFQRDEAAVQIK